MNQFKENVLHELQHVKLTDEKKQRIAQKVRNRRKHRSTSQRTYRIVLATFTLLAVGLSALIARNSQQRTATMQGAAVQHDTGQWSFWSYLANDWVKGMLLLSFFVIIAMIIKRILRKKGYGLPVCTACGEIWSAKQARKLYWKNYGQQNACPHCNKKLYRTQKSAQLAGMLNMPIPFMVIVLQAFDQFLIGLVFYMLSSVIFIYLLIPHIVKLQENDPSKEPLW
ncbi:TIGR04104 family putative zinc finger protein [Lysinibacillus sp. 38-6]|uniref:TIGR04104 family putative zinc finger protein n=1 Tax=Lysinibacillus sp. 38-6 TaxID=3385991 RepID=UPI0039089BF0